VHINDYENPHLPEKTYIQMTLVLLLGILQSCKTETIGRLKVNLWDGNRKECEGRREREMRGEKAKQRQRKKQKAKSKQQTAKAQEVVEVLQMN
jgi:hypothetical protein